MGDTSDLRREYTANDQDKIVSILGDAFGDDPVLSWMNGKENSTEFLFRRMFVGLYRDKGTGHIVGEGEGAALWLPPGNLPVSSPVQQFLFVKDALLAGCSGAITRGFPIESFMKKNHPHEPHYYLFAIGVRFGRKLFEPMLAKCDDEGMPAYLENSKEKNLGFYRAHGFEPVEGAPFEPAPGCPPMWPMWRKPR
jgi:hypothetical protein